MPPRRLRDSEPVRRKYSAACWLRMPGGTGRRSACPGRAAQGIVICLSSRRAPSIAAMAALLIGANIDQLQCSAALELRLQLSADTGESAGARDHFPGFWTMRAGTTAPYHSRQHPRPRSPRAARRRGGRRRVGNDAVTRASLALPILMPRIQPGCGLRSPTARVGHVEGSAPSWTAPWHAECFQIEILVRPEQPLEYRTP